MHRRLYFFLGDCLANTVTGVLAAWGGVVWSGPDGWPMPVAMLTGMVVGMAVSLFSQVPFLLFFGAMEVMLPVMLSGMVAGMAGPMGWAVAPASDGGRSVLLAGAAVGLAVVAYTYILNARVRGERVHHE